MICLNVLYSKCVCVCQQNTNNLERLSFKQPSICVCASVLFSFGVRMFLWSSDDFTSVRVWRLSWRRMHVCEREVRRGGEQERRMTREQVAISKTPHTLIFSLFKHPCTVHRHTRALKISSLCAVSTSLFAWRYSVSGLSSVSQVWLKRSNRISPNH